MHKCYISYKFEDVQYKNKIVKKFDGVRFIDRSQQEKIHSDNPDHIMQIIRDKYLKDSSVTIFLIGTRSYDNYCDSNDEKRGYDSQIIIRQEIRASLLDRKNNSRNGLLGVVLPAMENKVYGCKVVCSKCGKKHNDIKINNNTVIKEFAQNYHLKKNKLVLCDRCGESDRYAILVRYSAFMNDPERYIDMAFDKRKSPLANNVRVHNFS